MKELALKVDGIMCHKCVKKVTDVLMGKDGIEEVRVSEDFTTVTIHMDEDKINALQIGHIIEKIKDKSFKIIN